MLRGIWLRLPQVAGYVSGLQQPDGSFFGDEWGEVDTRFSYCALSSMAILGQLDSSKIDVKKAAEFVGRQANKYFNALVCMITLCNTRPGVCRLVCAEW